MSASIQICFTPEYLHTCPKWFNKAIICDIKWRCVVFTDEVQSAFLQPIDDCSCKLTWATTSSSIFAQDTQFKPMTSYFWIPKMKIVARIWC